MTTRHQTAHLRYTPYFCASALFAFILYLYICVMPVIPWNGDDWVYLSQFRDLFPSLTRGNPARIFPEVLHPLSGWLAALISAFWGGGGHYLDALIVSHALLMTTSITALTVALYLALRDIVRDAPLALCATLFFMLLSFSLFKSRPDGNIFLFHSTCLTVTTFYVWPNLLNSILVCYILHGYMTSTALRPSSLGAGCLMLGIFLAQFSMTFGSAIAAVFAGWICLLRLWRQSGTLRQKIAHYAQTGTFFDAALLIIMIFWITAAILDVSGGRYGRIQQSQWHFAAAWQGFCGVLAQINPATGVVCSVIFVAALACFACKRLARTWNTTDSQFFALCIICILSAGALLGMDLLISARTEVYTSGIHAVYNVFFCAILCVTLCAAYLVQSMPRLWLAAPLILALLFVECQNAEKPWARQPAEYRAVVQSWLDDIHTAEQVGERSAVITVPKAEWPHPPHKFDKALARALFAHGVTARRMNITLREASK